MTEINDVVSVAGDFGSSAGAFDFSFKETFKGKTPFTAEFRRVRGSYFISAPQLTGAGKFAQVDMATSPLRAMSSQLANLRPGASLASVVPAVNSMSDYGPAVIDGVATEQYFLLLDPIKASGLLSPGVPLTPALKARLPKQFAYTIFVSGNDLVQRVRYDGFAGETTIDYTNWGAPPHISAPPASSLVPAPPGL
jgi:hypothetical protein